MADEIPTALRQDESGRRPRSHPGDQLDATSRLTTAMSEGFYSIRMATYIRKACSPLGKGPDFGRVESARNSVASDI